MNYFFCSKDICKNEAQYVCFCACSEAFWCEKHLKMHLKTCNYNHAFDTLSELHDITIDGILKFLANVKLSKETLKEIALPFLTQNSQNHKSNIKKILNDLTSDLKEISDLIIKISEISEDERVSILISLTLQSDSDAEWAVEMLQNNLDSNGRLFYILYELSDKKLEILNKANNDLKLEQNFRKTCKFYEKGTFNWLISQAYKEYIKAYQKITSLYYIERINSEKLELFIYDTESKKELKKMLWIPCESLDQPKFIIPLSHGELLIHFAYKGYSTIFIIDKYYVARCLPPGGFQYYFTAIYFNGNIYCFGYNDSSSFYNSSSAKRFDLNKNRWISLASMTKYDDYGWRNIIFNGNILISRAYDRNILLYSIDIDSFSTIPYEFEHVPGKILLSTKERVYLIECGNDSWIYESEVGNVYAWNKIAESILQINTLDQAYCSYNNGGFYILIYRNTLRSYFKFDLEKKDLIEIACYTRKLAIKKVDGKLKEIKCDCYMKTFKLYSDYIKKGFTLYYIAENLEEIESLNDEIKHSSKNGSAYRKKGDILQNLGWNVEAIKCYDKAIQLKWDRLDTHIAKGSALYELGKNLEALECYNEVIKLEFQYELAYFRKAIVLYHLNRNLEAIKCFNIAIKINQNNPIYFCWRANVFNDLGQEEKAIHDFNRAHNLVLSPVGISSWTEDCIELLEMLSKLLEITVKAKEELQKLRDASQEHSEIVIEAMKKESIAKEQSSQLIKRAVEFFSISNKPIKEIQQIKREISDLEKAIVELVAMPNLLSS